MIGVLGGGSAGLSVAQAFDNSGYKNYTLVDRNFGKFLPMIYRIPLLGGLAFGGNDLITKLAITHHQRSVPFFEAKLFGGASVINGCVASLGSRASWKSIATTYSKIDLENIQIPQGYEVRKSNPGPLDKLLSNALLNQKMQRIDTLFHDQEGHGEVCITRGRIFRSNPSFSFNKNCGVRAELIRLTPRPDCIVVETDAGEMSFEKVILCLGVRGTLSLLANSFASYRSKRRIFDHPNFRVKVKMRNNSGISTLNSIERSSSLKFRAVLDYLIKDMGLLQGPGASYVIYKDFDGDGEVDTKIQLVNFTEKGRLSSSNSQYRFDDFPGFSFAITLIKQGSAGFFDGQTKNISIEYLADDSEIVLLCRAVKFIEETLSQLSMCDLVDEIIDHHSYSEAYFKENVYSGYHLIGGHEMKGGWNLDAGLSLKNDNRIFVVDGSSFQIFPSSNIALPISVLAQRWSEFFMREIINA